MDSEADDLRQIHLERASMAEHISPTEATASTLSTIVSMASQKAGRALLICLNFWKRCMRSWTKEEPWMLYTWILRKHLTRFLTSDCVKRWKLADLEGTYSDG